MGCDAKAILFFGVSFSEDAEFPWDECEGIEEWWMVVNGYENPEPSPYDEKTGEYKPGYSYEDPRTQAYLDHKIEWKEAHPMPVEIVWHGSYVYSVTALACPGTVISAWWGEPKEVTTNNLNADPVVIKQFCEKYGIELPHEPMWLLCAYYG